ncbi:MAG: hypothetical protein ACKPKO_38955, partial [Candidatus Fonsibacter sp.]
MVEDDSSLSDVSLLHLDMMCQEYPSFKWEAVAGQNPGDPYWSVASLRERAKENWHEVTNLFLRS